MDLGGPEIDVSIFLLKSLGLDPCLLFLRSSCSISDFFLIINGPLKGHVSNFISCYISNSLTSLLSSPHPKHFSFRYGGKKLFGLWKGLDWCCWPVCLCICWIWFGTLWLWKVLLKFQLKTVSIIFEEFVVVMSTHDVSRVSKTSSTVNGHLLLSWCLCSLS